VSKLGGAPEAPLLRRQKSGHLSTHYIFIASCTMRFSWSVFTFVFSFFFLFAAINGWTPTNFFWRRITHFSFAKNTPFSLLSFNECSLFLELRLAFIFRLDFCSDFVLSLHLGVFGPLVYVVIHQKSCFQKGSNGVGKEKSFMQKSGTKRSLFRLRLRLLHAMIDVVLIVCLVIFAVV
jgi:hypothetical protein